MPPSGRQLGIGCVDQHALMLFGQDRPQGRQGHPRFDRDRHVGERIIDQPADARRVDGHARPARNAPVIERGPSTLRIDRMPERHLLAHASDRASSTRAGRRVASALRPSPSVPPSGESGQVAGAFNGIAPKLGPGERDNSECPGRKGSARRLPARSG